MRYRIPTAFFLSLFFFLWAAFRPLDVAHDTDLYFDLFGEYFSEYGDRFSELTFGWIASGLATILDEIPNGKEIGGRFFLVFIALLESLLFFFILKRKKTSEACLMAFGFGPLIFLDIIRQGLAMLLAGLFIAENKSKRLYLIGAALATHIVAVIALLKFQLGKNQKIIFLVAMLLGFVVVYFLQDALQNKFDYYFRIGYFFDLSEMAFTSESMSVANVLVILFFVYAGIVGGFTKNETLILIALYTGSILFPLLFRVYFFYFFVISCSRDMLMSHKRIPHIIFNMGYAFILLRFFMNAFQLFDK